MPHCDYCDAWVSKDYYQHWAVDGVLHCCVHCPDRVRGSNSKHRDARAQRNNGTSADFSRGMEGDD